MVRRATVQLRGTTVRYRVRRSVGTAREACFSELRTRCGSGRAAGARAAASWTSDGLLERDHDTQSPASHLDSSARRRRRSGACESLSLDASGSKRSRPPTAGPAGGTLPAFAEERQAAALDVHGDERIVGGGQILRRGDDVVVLVAAHHDRHVARSISARTSRTDRSPRWSLCRARCPRANGRNVARPSMLLYLSISARP